MIKWIALSLCAALLTACGSVPSGNRYASASWDTFNYVNQSVPNNFGAMTTISSGMR